MEDTVKQVYATLVSDENWETLGPNDYEIVCMKCANKLNKGLELCDDCLSWLDR